MKITTIIIIFLALIISGCDEYFTEKIPNPTPTITMFCVHTKLPERWKMQRNEKNKYRLIKPDGKILDWWGDRGGSSYENMQNAIDGAWEYVQMQIDKELELKWHDIQVNNDN